MSGVICWNSQLEDNGIEISMQNERNFKQPVSANMANQGNTCLENVLLNFDQAGKSKVNSNHNQIKESVQGWK